MNTFSIERAAEQIPDARTRELFREVQSSFANGNLRSALVTLWSVVVCDLIWKLEDLRDLEGDSTASKILDLMAKSQAQNPKSPAWEDKLVTEVRDRTRLFDPADFEAIDHLHQLRHLCAHPVLTDAGLLHRPNRDTVRACIRTALQAVLRKPPVFTKEVIQTFLVDLSQKKALLLDEPAVAAYVQAKYLHRMDPLLEDALFRALWKLVFRTENQEANENREVNVRALATLYRRRPTELVSYTRDHTDFFSNVASGEPLEHLVLFLGTFPQLYDALSQSAKTLIESACNQDFSLRAIAWFLGPNLESHLAKLETECSPENPIGSEVWEKMKQLADCHGLRKPLLRIGIKHYTVSDSFDEANSMWSTFIAPHLDEFDDELLEALLAGIEQNDQTTGRRRARSGHRLFLERFENVLGYPPNPDSYPKFYESISDE